MSGIRVGCQTYTWEMLGADWHGSVTDILDWVAEAGYDGVEITNSMIGEFAGRPEAFAEELRQRDLALACFAYARNGFTDPKEEQADLQGAREAVEFVRHFPGVQLGLGGAASPEVDLTPRPPLHQWRGGDDDITPNPPSTGAPSERVERGLSGDIRAKTPLDRGIAFYNAVGEIAAAAGVPVNVHPHSHYGSLLETAEEYAYLLNALLPTVMFGPDTGHIVRGGQDLLTCLRTNIGRITHLHLKDANANREWVGLGEGLCDFPGVMALLEEVGYAGWVVAEEESAAARQDGVAAIRRNREYMRGIGY